MLDRFTGYKRLLALAALNGGGASIIERTATGNPLTFVTDLARPLKSLLIPFTPQQEGTGDPSPQNIRSIIPWNGLTVFGGGKNLLNVDRTEASPNPTDISNATSPRVMDTSHYFVGIRSDNYYYKNYVVLATVVNGTISVQSTNNNDYGIGFPVAVKGGQKYTLSAVAEQGFFVSFGYYDSEWHYLSGTSFYNLSPATVTVPYGAYYMVIVFRSTLDTTFTYSDVQLEVGQTATAYEPYKPITDTDIVFPSPVYGGTPDIISGRMLAKWAKIVLNGTEVNWSDYNQGTAFSVPIIGMTKDNYKTVFCDRFAQIKNITSFGVYASASNDYAYFINATDIEGVTDLASWKAYLAENPMEFAYELATPQEIQLTPAQITAIVGDNTIWSDADGQMAAVYLLTESFGDEHPISGGLGSGLLGGGFGSGSGEQDEPAEPDEPGEPDQPDEPAEPDQPGEE